MKKNQEHNKVNLQDFMGGVGLSIVISAIALMGLYHTLESIYDKLQDEKQLNYEYDSGEKIEEKYLYEDVYEAIENAFSRRLKK